MIPREKSLTLLIPAHNEEESIEKVVSSANKELQKLGIKYDVIVINDGSTDKTAELLKKFDFISVITNPYNLGYGASLKKGIKNSAGDWIMIVDSDGTYPLESTGELIKFAGEYDMVVGSRKHDYDYFGRKPAKWILKKIAGFLAGRDIPDLNSGMRIFSRTVAMDFFDLFPSGFSFTSTITLACFANDYTVKYVDIPYYQRKGQSGIKPKHFFDFLVLIIKIFIYFKPLRMLSPVFLLFLVLGVSKAVKDLLAVGYIGTLSSILILLSMQIFFLSLISEVIIKRGSR